MRWEDERYVRAYTRDTIDWLGLEWEAQALFLFLLRKVDRAGLLELGKSGPGGLAAFVRMPSDVVQRALPRLIEDGCVEVKGTTLVVRNFIEAQEASMSPTHRQRESRERRRDMIRAGLDPNQRATVIYFVQSEQGGHVKIGRADDLAKRLQQLATGRPDRLVVLGAVPGTVEDERLLQDLLSPYRDKGEWFFPNPTVMVAAKAARADATIRDVFAAVTHHESQPVTNGTGHESRPVTPSRAVPIQPSLASRADLRGERSSKPDETSPEAARAAGTPIVVVEANDARSPYDAAMSHYSEAFRKRYKREFRLTSFGRDGSDEWSLVRIGRLAEANGDMDLWLGHWMRAYLKDDEKWLADNAHPPRALERRLNKYGEPKKPKLAPPKAAPPAPVPERPFVPLKPIAAPTVRASSTPEELADKARADVARLEATYGKDKP